MRKIDQFNVGDKAEFKHIITEKDVQKFIEITGDDNPVHTDSAFAKRTAMKKVVVHGMLSASFISTIIGKYLPGDGALWVSQSLNFLSPVKIGDELTVYAEVLKKHTKQNLLAIKVEIRNQHKQIVVEGESQVKILEIEEPGVEIPSEKGQPPIIPELEALEIKRPLKIEKNVVLITGASRGIGAATAVYLAKKGYCVAINYCRDRTGAEEVMKRIEENNGRAIICQADVTNPDAVKGMVSKIIEKYGTVTALVNNATSEIAPQDFNVLEWTDIQAHIDVQLKGAFNCIKAVLNEFLKNKSGAVVNLGSIASDNVPPSKWTGYTLVKSALQSFTKSLALEFGPKRIRFNIVSPGMTNTGLIYDVPEKVRLMLAMQTPLRKLAEPDDIARAIAFLLSEEARHITGETLRVCGGQVML